MQKYPKEKNLAWYLPHRGVKILRAESQKPSGEGLFLGSNASALVRGETTGLVDGYYPNADVGDQAEELWDG